MKKLLFSLLWVTVICHFAAAQNSGSPSRRQIDIYYYVPFIPQPTSASCWSASIAMILWWRDVTDRRLCMPEALTPVQVAANMGYWRQYFRDGLSSYDSRPFEEFGFTTVQPMSFPVETLVGFLSHGPVWVAYNGCENPLVNCGHAVVLIGIQGDGTIDGTEVILHDPDDGSGVYPNLGERDRRMPYSEFIQRLDERALHRLAQPAAQMRPVNFLAFLKN